ncbi:MAG: site-specific integrase, partial [Deltaproteobacteria bacterium]|nr:site-specific integrase [Deltaproteobacteria bacterium]
KSMKGVSCAVKGSTEYWYARIDGNKKYCGIGEKGKKIAIAAKAKEITRKYENKEVNAGLKVKKVEFKNFTKLCNWYMQQPSIQEQAGYKRKVSGCKHLISYFGNRGINQIEGTDQEKYRTHRKQQGAKDGTINLEIEILSAAYNMALKDKKIQFSDKPGRFVFKFSHNPRRKVTEEEYTNLLINAEPDLRDLIIAGYESAMRSGELCNLTANKVHLDIKHISGKTVDYIDLGIFDAKNKTRRTVPVSEEFKIVLQRRLKGLDTDDLVFTKEGRKWSRNKIALEMAELCKKAEIPYGDNVLNKRGERIGIVFHCFRHTRITRWVEMGFSDEIIRRASGHKDLKAYRNYVKLDPVAVMRLVRNNEFKTGRAISVS